MSRSRFICQINARYRNRVRECRLTALVATQEELSKMTKISRSTINALENNRLFLSSQYALLIAEALRCKLDDLYEKKPPDDVNHQPQTTRKLNNGQSG